MMSFIDFFGARNIECNAERSGHYSAIPGRKKEAIWHGFLTVGQIGLQGATASGAMRVARLSRAAKLWDKATFRTRYGSMRHHYKSHGTGQGMERYSKEAVEFFKTNKRLGTSHPLKVGGTGIRIRTKTYFGIYTKSGRIITYGPK